MKNFLPILNRREILRFWIPLFDIVTNYFTLALIANFWAKRGQNGSKYQKT